MKSVTKTSLNQLQYSYFLINRFHVPSSVGFILLVHLGIIVIGIIFGIVIVWIDPSRKGPYIYDDLRVS